MLIVAIVLDTLLGDPNYRFHPIRLMGNLITQLEKWLYSAEKSDRQLFISGAVLVLICVTIVGAAATLLHSACLAWVVGYGWIVEGIVLSQLLATRSLYAEGARIDKVLANGTIDEARQQIGYLVSRETKDLTKRDIYQAAVETMTENTTDAIVAPLFYYALFGFVGIAVYKMINTLDSMVGYHNQRYEYFGKFAARLDDVANFVPARLAAFFIIMLAFLMRDDGLGSLRCYIKQRNTHNSVNAGCTEAALAGAIGIKLSGPTYYFGKLKKRPYIGYGTSEITAKHLRKSMRYVIGVAMFSYLITLLVMR